MVLSKQCRNKSRGHEPHDFLTIMSRIILVIRDSYLKLYIASIYFFLFNTSCISPVTHTTTREEAKENFWWGAQPQFANKQTSFEPSFLKVLSANVDEHY